jgi:hypothetical protein
LLQIPEADLVAWWLAEPWNKTVDQRVTELLEQVDSCFLSGNFPESGDLFLSRLVAAKDIVVHIDLETVLFIMLIQRK